MATRSRESGAKVPRSSPLRTLAGISQSIGEVPSRSRSRHRTVSGPHKLSDPDPSSSLPGHPLAAPPLASTSFLASKPVWPSNRFVWPPPCCVRKVWSAGQKGVRSREFRCSHLLGGRRTCWDEVGGAGLPQPVPFWHNWRRQRLARKHLSFRSVQSKLGGRDGQAFLLAQQRRLWRLHCTS